MPQLAQLWVKQGGDPKQALKAAAIAEAESRGNTDAVGFYSPSLKYDTPTPQSDTSQTDEGVWQIANLHAGATGATVVQSLLDPATNANAAISISGNGQNWNDWSTFRKGTYLTYMTPENAQQVASAIYGQGSYIGPNPINTLNQNLTNQLFTFPKAFWNIATTWQWAIIGIGILLIGLFIILSSESTQNFTINTAKAAKKYGTAAASLAAE